MSINISSFPFLFLLTTPYFSGFHWDDGDLKTESMLPHAPSRNQYLRNDPAYPPSSPCSYNSSSTYVSRRSQRSHKTSALSGHYSSGRRRAEKQLIQMIKMNEVFFFSLNISSFMLMTIFC